MKKRLCRAILHQEYDHQQSILNRGLRLITRKTLPKFFGKAFYSAYADEKRLWAGRESALTISFDCDGKKDYEALPGLLDLLSSLHLPASFAVIGRWVEEDPAIHRKIIADGHEIVNHSYSHPSSSMFRPGTRFNQLSCQEKREEILRAHNSFLELLQYTSTGFRTPHFASAHTKDIYDILGELGYKYSSSLKATDAPYFNLPFLTSNGIVEFPLSADINQPYTCFDTWNRFKGEKRETSSASITEFFLGVRIAVEKTIENNGYFNIYFDPVDFVMFPEFRECLSIISDLRDHIHITTYRDILPLVQEQKTCSNRKGYHSA
ncbi:MAG: polysaccharide deacetylase family protein [Candidatus Cloacimonetes bacterium]|nr:polysaccharide deacetylase family protein [Candidatus Cloacimonadota bacterium]